MTDLTPVLRPDYTGKLVTRHMRMESGKASSLGIPAPAAQGFTTEIKRIESKLLKILEVVNSEFDVDDWSAQISSAMYLDPDDLLGVDELRDAISRLPLRTIARIDEKLSNESESDEDYAIVLIHALTYNGDDPQLIEYLTYFHSSVEDIYDGEDLSDRGANSYAVLHDCLNGLRHYGHLGYVPPQDIYQSTDEEHITAKALCMLRFAAQRLEGLTFTGTTEVETGTRFKSSIVTSEEFVRVMLDRPDDRHRLLDIIEERDSNHPDLIMSILDAPAPSMAEGVL
jgi:hypothetical protein